MSGEYIGKDSMGCLPNITGSAGYTVKLLSATGAFYEYSQGGPWYNQWGSGDGGYVNPFIFNAQRCSYIYGSGWFDGDRVVPASLGMMFIIKY